MHSAGIDIEGTRRVRESLDFALKPVLEGFVERVMTKKHGSRWLEYASRPADQDSHEPLDIYGLCKTILDNWNSTFRHRFDRKASYKVERLVSTVFEARNNTAHLNRGPLSDAEALYYLFSMVELASVLSGPSEIITRLGEAYAGQRRSRGGSDIKDASARFVGPQTASGAADTFSVLETLRSAALDGARSPSLADVLRALEWEVKPVDFESPMVREYRACLLAGKPSRSGRPLSPIEYASSGWPIPRRVAYNLADRVRSSDQNFSSYTLLGSSGHGGSIALAQAVLELASNPSFFVFWSFDTFNDIPDMRSMDVLGQLLSVFAASGFVPTKIIFAFDNIHKRPFGATDVRSFHDICRRYCSTHPVSIAFLASSSDPDMVLSRPESTIKMVLHDDEREALYNKVFEHGPFDVLARDYGSNYSHFLQHHRGIRSVGNDVVSWLDFVLSHSEVDRRLTADRFRVSAPDTIRPIMTIVAACQLFDVAIPMHVAMELAEQSRSGPVEELHENALLGGTVVLIEPGEGSDWRGIGLSSPHCARRILGQDGALRPRSIFRALDRAAWVALTAPRTRAEVASSLAFIQHLLRRLANPRRFDVPLPDRPVIEESLFQSHWQRIRRLISEIDDVAAYAKWANTLSRLPSFRDGTAALEDHADAPTVDVRGFVLWLCELAVRCDSERSSSPDVVVALLSALRRFRASDLIPPLTQAFAVAADAVIETAYCKLDLGSAIDAALADGSAPQRRANEVLSAFVQLYASRGARDHDGELRNRLEMMQSARNQHKGLELDAENLIRCAGAEVKLGLEAQARNSIALAQQYLATNVWEHGWWRMPLDRVRDDFVIRFGSFEGAQQ